MTQQGAHMDAPRPTHEQITGSLTLPAHVWVKVLDLASPELGNAIYDMMVQNPVTNALKEFEITFSGEEALEIEARNLSGYVVQGSTI